jgi:hypothetical protein
MSFSGKAAMSSAYEDGYEDGLAWKRMPDPKKHYHIGKDRDLYEAGHTDGQGDWAECYADGRTSVIKCEEERVQTDFYELSLYHAYKLGRKAELDA